MNEFYNLLSSFEIKNCKKFIKKHSSCYAGAIGGGISYIITPTGLGDIYSVKCNVCNKELTLINDKYLD